MKRTSTIETQKMETFNIEVLTTVVFFVAWRIYSVQVMLQEALDLKYQNIHPGYQNITLQY